MRVIAIRFALLCWALGAISKAFGAEPEVTYRIDSFWLYQSALEVSDMNVDIGTPRLNLFNAHFVATIRVDGAISLKEPRRRPFIKRVHVSERFVPSSTDPERVVELQVTPIVETEVDADYDGATVPFTLSIPYNLRTYQWGVNHFTVVVSGREQRFEVTQYK